MGFDRAKNYDASWAEWGNLDDTPKVLRQGGSKWKREVPRVP
jgi:3-mercaptopyruvate sulfurtransferase SseA